MKRSKHVAVAALSVIGLAACGARRDTSGGPGDPCRADFFQDSQCREAVSQGGYYHGGMWYPMLYSRPYGYYYDSYQSRMRGGGTGPVAAGKPAGAPVPAASAPRAGRSVAPVGEPAAVSGRSAPASVSRGGFGSSAGEGSGS